MFGHGPKPSKLKQYCGHKSRVPSFQRQHKSSQVNMLSTSLQIVTVVAFLAIFQGVCAEDVSIFELFVHVPSFYLRG